MPDRYYRDSERVHTLEDLPSAIALVFLDDENVFIITTHTYDDTVVTYSRFGLNMLYVRATMRSDDSLVQKYEVPLAEMSTKGHATYMLLRNCGEGVIVEIDDPALPCVFEYRLTPFD